MQDNNSSRGVTTEELSQESFEKRLFTQTTVEDYLMQMVGDSNLDSSDDEEDALSECPSILANRSITSLNAINLDEVAALAEYLQELMEDGVVNETEDCDLSTLPDAIKAMENLKIDDDASLASATASLASFVEKNKISSSTLERIIQLKKEQNRKKGNSANSVDDNKTVDKIYKESERQEQDRLNRILGRNPPESMTNGNATPPTKSIRMGIKKTFQDRQESMTVGENSAASNPDERTHRTWPAFRPIAKSVDSPEASDAGNTNGNRFVSDDTSVGSITEDIEVVIAKHRKRLEDEVGEIQSLSKGGMSKEGTNTMVSSLSFDATQYAKARAKLGIEDPDQAELQSADVEDLTQEESEGWWVQAEKMLFNSDKTPSPPISIGKSKDETPDTPSTVVCMGNILGLATPEASDMGTYDLESNKGKSSVSRRLSFSKSKWDRIPFMKRAFDRYGTFMVWVMISALAMMILCVILVISAFARIDNSDGGSDIVSAPVDSMVPPQNDDVVDEITSMDPPPIKPHPTLGWTFDEEEEEFYPIMEGIASEDEPTEIPSSDFWNSVDDDDDDDDDDGQIIDIVNVNEAESTQIPSTDFWNSFDDDGGEIINEWTETPSSEFHEDNSEIVKEAVPTETPSSEVWNSFDDDGEIINEVAPTETPSSEVWMTFDDDDGFGNENVTAISDTEEEITSISASDHVEFGFFEQQLRTAISLRLPESLSKFNDPSSPQARALKWLKFNPLKVSELKFKPIFQKYVLLVLYFSTNGENWRFKKGWLTETDECEWYNTAGSGYVCDEFGRVTDIDLISNRLNGTLPSELILLNDHITKIRVNGNQLQGTLPSFIGRMVNLQRVHAHYNSFSGTIPTNLSNLTRLKSLRLRNNKITGTIPWQIRDLQRLEALVLEGNQLTGTLPFFLGDLTNLNELNFGHNALTGTIPFEIMDLQKMVNLTLDRNNLTGSMPPAVCNYLPFLEVAKVDCEEVVCSCCEGCSA